MKNTDKMWLKVIAISIIGILSLAIVSGLFKAFFRGNYFNNAPLWVSLLVIVAAISVIYLAVKWVRYFLNLSILSIAMLLFLSACSFSKSNQQVLVSNDCGVEWKKIAAGDAVPTGATNPCYMKVVIPNYPMQGETRFISNLKGKVRAVVHIDYDYSIQDGLSFIKQAKYLGNTNSSVDDQSNESTNFEQAENMVIDKRLKDVVKDILLEEDIVELDQNELENIIHEKTNKVLKPFGVELNFITLTFDLDEQTRQAIDIATAMKIYESNGLSDIGKQIMVSRAGATKITVEQKTPAENKQ